jgi:tRNA threonylcarbamoyladenosine biosynthesis protein TsaE
MRESDALRVVAADEAQTRHLGALLARAVSPADESGLVIALQGELGAGKTTLVRGLLRALGIVDSVRSPTYTLIETYSAGEWTIQHLDWYRLAGTDDLEALGFRDLLGPSQLIVLEWPERAPAVAASADLHLELKYLPAGRELIWRAQTAIGERVLKVFRAVLDAETSM